MNRIKNKIKNYLFVAALIGGLLLIIVLTIFAVLADLGFRWGCI